MLWSRTIDLVRWGLVGVMVLLAAACTAEPPDPATAIIRSDVVRRVEDAGRALDSYDSPDCRGSTRRVVAIDAPEEVDLGEIERAANLEGWETWWSYPFEQSESFEPAPQLAFEREFAGEMAHMWVTLQSDRYYGLDWTLTLVGDC